MHPICVPERFREKIARVFGATGSEWLRGLDQRVEVVARRWQLQNLQLAPVLSYNLLCFAESPAYGPVALKLGVPNPELYSEMEALHCYGGRGICVCHESDRELGALLLERVMPGDDLHTVPDWRERIRIAAALIGSLPVPAPARHGFPTYSDQVARAFARVRREGRAGERLLGLVETAEGLFRSIDRPAWSPPASLKMSWSGASSLPQRSFA